MDFRQLKYLVALAEVKHFAHAAEACYVTQPTLSSRIRQLEEDFGVPLVIRDHRYRGLTPYGQRVVDWSKHVLGTYEEIREEFAHLHQAGGRVSVGIEPSASPLMALILSFLKSRDVEVGIDFKTLDSKAVCRQISNNALELGVVYKDFNRKERDEFETPDSPSCYELCEETYVAFTTDENGPKLPSPLEWSDLVDFPLCMPSTDIPAYDVIAPFFGEKSEQNESAMATDCWLTMFQAVRRNNMVGIAPRHLLGMMALPPGTRIEPLPAPSNPLTLCLLARPATTIEPALARVVASLDEFSDYFHSQSDEMESPGVAAPRIASV